MVQTCSLAVTIHCSPERFCPAAGVVRDRKSCPGHLVGICELPAVVILRSPDGTGVQLACGEHRLWMIGERPTWLVEAIGRKCPESPTGLHDYGGPGQCRWCCPVSITTH